ncbi:MAG: hypothetical protein QOJ35_479 [Solirubrobacteraceae bacterium]|nr:hypothetical protein [Solirubrobacteraceae bacterium]
MTEHALDALVAVANPIDEPALAALALGEEERLLCEAIVAPQARAALSRRAARRPQARAALSGRAARPHARATLRGLAAKRVPRRRQPAALPVAARPPARAALRGLGGRRLQRSRLLAALAVAALGAAAILAPTGRETGSSGTAWAAPLVRLAESSPLLLLDAPGWSVARADETDEVEGEMTFTLGGAPPYAKSAAGRERVADLNWRRGPIELWKRDRAHDATLVVQRTVLGQPAQISQYPDSTDFAAIWPDGSRVLEFRSVAADLAAFERRLAALRRVDVDTWLSAMPASVVKSANRAPVVEQMLADIPLPPRFDRSPLERRATVSDRYQLGAQVTGAVACAWIDRWAAARKAGDGERVRAAIAAMQTSRRWRILREMAAEGAWSQVLWDYADAMRGDGTWFGRPLQREIRGGLGCGG